MTEITFKVYKYTNATHIKMKNRRVIVESSADGEYLGVAIKSLTSKENAATPAVTHAVTKGVIKTTTLILNKDSAKALFHSLGRQLDIIKNPHDK